ncbi:hypothetical protein [Hydrogenovibrio kuenenii]|uniref:hypothetical protein n=1 Tax=Hydrogenovibrio kuenenii TaxID=63658 RepID=UPI00046306ED|nr:hypothetical protein [Hydrogenovibrio kuenenii]
MVFFELEPADISNLNDSDLRELVARLCEAELTQKSISTKCVSWGGAQEAPDGGLDVSVSGAATVDKMGFVPRPNTGFQVKKHSMGQAACAKEMLDGGDVKNVIKDLACVNGAYIIVSGKDDCTDSMLKNRLLGMASAVSDLDEKDDLFLDFYGRDRLCSWLRRFPGVALWARLRLGKPLSGWKPYGRWAATPADQIDDFLLDEHPCVFDTNLNPKSPVSIRQGVETVRQKLSVAGSVVRITGLSGVGKTRFAQALFEDNVGSDALPMANVIYADLGNNLTPTATELISYLTANDLTAYVVLDNCPPDAHRQLQKQVSLSEGVKLSLLTIEYDISDDRPEETEVVHIEPSSHEIVSKLIQRRFPELGQLNARTIAEFAGGNARIAIALASQVDANESLINFSDDDLFQRLFHQRKGRDENLLESAEILSLVYSFNVSKTDFNDELETLAQISGLERRTLSRSQSELLQRQVAQQRGDWRAILPHALANRLAKRALQYLDFQDINTYLFKSENFRLLKSCAHRLGYLHDYEPAQQLAETWMLPGGPLNDLGSCDAQQLAVISYIAPVFPETLLQTIERASSTPNFCTRENKQFSTFVTLLRKVAYYDEYFDRAAGLILKFAESERKGENHNSIVNHLRELFSLYLSGTLATPERRRSFLKHLMCSDIPRQNEIAKELFSSAFQTSHWSSTTAFDFGARAMSYGWEPRNRKEQNDWYEGFTLLLSPLLKSGDELHEKWAKDLLAQNFRSLWSFAGCIDILEELITHNVNNGDWTEIWQSIKETLYFDGKNHPPEILLRLEKLEKLSAPKNLISEIRAYIFTPPWDLIKGKGKKYSEESYEEAILSVERLGVSAAAEPEIIRHLIPELWESRVASIDYFGKGFGIGVKDKRKALDLVIDLMTAQQCLEVEYSGFFYGFIQGIFETAPEIIQEVQSRFLDQPGLKPHAIHLLDAIPLTSWGEEKIIELAQKDEIEAWRFNQIGYGRIGDSIPDSRLIELLSILNQSISGSFSVISILRGFIHKDKSISSMCSECLRAFKNILTGDRDETKNFRLDDLDDVLDVCFNTTSDEVAKDIIDEFVEGMISYRLWSYEWEKVIEVLVRKFPEIVLDSVFVGHCEDDYNHCAYEMFRGKLHRSISPLNLVEIEKLVQWCGKNQERVNQVATAVSIYIPVDKVSPLENPKKVCLSDQIKTLIDLAADKTEIVEIIAARIRPSSWSGSLTDILEVRAKAFEELLTNDSAEVRKAAIEKLKTIHHLVKVKRSEEAKENAQREQRFE